MTQAPGTSKYKTQMKAPHALKHSQIQSLDFHLGLQWGEISAAQGQTFSIAYLTFQQA